MSDDKRLEDVVFHHNGDGQAEYDPFDVLPGDPPDGEPYEVCNALLDAETNEHCEWDGRVSPSMMEGLTIWRCPACHRRRVFTQEAGQS